MVCRWVVCVDHDRKSAVKKCIKCKEEKEETEFYKDRARKDGLTRYCKVCQKVHLKKWQKKNQSNHLEEFITPPTKLCKQCGVEKLSNNFYRSTSAIDGLSAKCIDCESKYQKQLLIRGAIKRNDLSRIKNLNSSWLNGLIRYKKLYSPTEFTCGMESCSNQSDLYHHIRYDSRSIEQPFSIIAPLCKECHTLFHIRQNEGIDLTDKILTQIELEYIRYKSPHIRFIKEK